MEAAALPSLDAPGPLAALALLLKGILKGATDAGSLVVAVPILSLLYITFRLVRPGWQLSTAHGNRLVIPVGLWGGIMQGAGGIGARVSVTFLNALRLERPVFIATISAFFAVMSVIQIPTLWSLGLLGADRLAQGLVAFALLLFGMPIGEALARRMSAATFDRLMLILLAIIALRLFWTAPT